MMTRTVVAALALGLMSISAYAADERNPEQRAPNEPSTHPQYGRTPPANAQNQETARASDTGSSQRDGYRRAERSTPDFVRDGLTYPERNRAFHRVGTP
jgi:hypothetical protein